jgi:hypothetical protein
MVNFVGAKGKKFWLQAVLTAAPRLLRDPVRLNEAEI